MKLIVNTLGAGTETCAGYPASLGYEEIDAQAFAEWGVDCELPTWPHIGNIHSNCHKTKISNTTTAISQQIDVTNTIRVNL